MVMDDYQRGFRDGWVSAMQEAHYQSGAFAAAKLSKAKSSGREKARKLSAWQKFVKTNSKMPRFKYKTGKRKGMVNMKALAAAWKRKKR